MRLRDVECAAGGDGFRESGETSRARSWPPLGILRRLENRVSRQSAAGMSGPTLQVGLKHAGSGSGSQPFAAIGLGKKGS
jgi:hypothetical protein